MKLTEAKPLAEKIAERLRPRCTRVEIVGSIRRERPEPGDIDLVILTDNREAVRARCLERCQLVTNGDINFVCRLPGGFQLDIFFARGPVTDLFNPQPGNFASLMLLRTGSREHNIFLIERAKLFGLRWDTYRGVLDPEGYVISGDDETSIYNRLDLPFIEPRLREGAYMMEHFYAKQKSESRKQKSEETPNAEPVAPAPPTAAGLAALAELHAFAETLKGEG